MIVKIVGFKVNQDRSTCYYKVECPNLDVKSMEYQLRKGKEKTEGDFNREIESVIGHYMRLALQKSDFVSVRK